MLRDPVYSLKEFHLARYIIDLQLRKIHPEGSFGRNGKWFPDQETDSLLAIRKPSVKWPYSYMLHCRTAKYQCQLNQLDEKRVKQVIRDIKTDKPVILGKPNEK